MSLHNEENEKAGDWDGNKVTLTPADHDHYLENGELGDTGQEGLHRRLHSRHLVFISLGSVIGTGIFLGVGGALAKSGPIGLILGYILICSVLICVMGCVGEMVTYLPVVGAHFRLAARFVDPALSAAMSWNYWYCWSIIIAAEVSAVAVLVTFWTEKIHAAVWISIALALILIINMFGPRVYGEMEFLMSTIKVITIVGLIILGIVLNCGGGPKGGYTGFRYWTPPYGPFVQYLGIKGTTGRFLGFFAGLTSAVFSSIGTENLCLAAAETSNPRRVLPRALRATWIRILLFYLLSVFIVSIIVPSNDPRLGSSSTAAASPFVLAIKDAGIKGLDSVINAAMVTSAFSAGVGQCFTASRTLHSMAGKRFAPVIFQKTTRWGCPWVAVLTTWLLGCIGFLAVDKGANKVFTFLLNMTALSGVLTWACIAITFIRFRAGLKAQGMNPKDLPYTSMFGLAGAYWTIFIIAIITLFSGWTVFRTWNTADFFGNYLPIALFLLIYCGFKFIGKTRFVRAHEMDLHTGVDKFDRQEREAEEEAMARGGADTFGKKMSRWIVG